MAPPEDGSLGDVLEGELDRFDAVADCGGKPIVRCSFSLEVDIIDYFMPPSSEYTPLVSTKAVKGRVRSCFVGRELMGGESAQCETVVFKSAGRVDVALCSPASSNVEFEVKYWQPVWPRGKS
jgi:hypothetical protein